jgi:serine/threonine protein kinase
VSTAQRRPGDGPPHQSESTAELPVVQRADDGSNGRRAAGARPTDAAAADPGPSRSDRPTTSALPRSDRSGDASAAGSTAMRVFPPGIAVRRGETPRFGPFTLLDEIACSANSLVYRARQDDLHGRIVALKILAARDGVTGEFDDSTERFKREVANVARLRHPNVVAIHDIGETDGFIYFSMAYIDGCSLAQWIADHGPLSAVDAAKLFIKIARAIHFAHAHGIIHRDIKPANILLDRHSGEPMIADFGLAKDMHADVKITQSGITLGTPPYMPPEQARGRQDLLDSRSDVYALGATLYEAVTGRPPFDGETGMQVLMRVLETAPVRPRRIVPKLAGEFEAIILKCLSKARRDRYENAEMLAQDLTRYTRGDWVKARKATTLLKLGRALRSYRDLLYVLVVVLLVSAGHNAATLFSERGVTPERRGPLRVPDAAASWEPVDPASEEVVETLSAFDLWLHGDRTPGAARALYVYPRGLSDIELSFVADFYGGSDLTVFVTSDPVPAGSGEPAAGDALVARGYAVEFGADDNSRFVIYRDGVPVYASADPGLRLRRAGGRARSMYHIRVGFIGHRIEVEFTDDTRRTRIVDFLDDHPPRMPAGARIGLATRNAKVAISDFELAVLTRAVSDSPMQVDDTPWRLGAYADAALQYRQVLRMAADDADDGPGSRGRLRRRDAEERLALVTERIVDSPAVALAVYDDFIDRYGATSRTQRRQFVCAMRSGRFDQAPALADRLLESPGDRPVVLPLLQRLADEVASRAVSQAVTGGLLSRAAAMPPAVPQTQPGREPAARRAGGPMDAALALYRRVRDATDDGGDPVLHVAALTAELDLRAWALAATADPGERRAHQAAINRLLALPVRLVAGSVDRAWLRGGAVGRSEFGSPWTPVRPDSPQLTLKLAERVAAAAASVDRPADALRLACRALAADLSATIGRAPAAGRDFLLGPIDASLAAAGLPSSHPLRSLNRLVADDLTSDSTESTIARFIALDAILADTDALVAAGRRLKAGLFRAVLPRR